VPVAVVAQQTMQNWLGHLRDAGLEPDIMVPDVLALPLPENDWTVLHDGGDVLVRQGIYAGAAIDTPAAADWFDLALAEQGDTPPRLRLFDCQYGREDGLTLHNMDTVDALAQPDLPLQWLAQHFSSTHSINLIQGDYSPREQIGRLLRPWRPAAALLLVLALLGAARMVTDVVSLSGTSERLAAAINQVYLDTFPDARKVVDARVQMERKLAELGSGSARAGRGFLSLLALSSKPLQEIDSVELQHASYQDGRLSLALRINSLQLLEQLKQALLRDKLLNVEIQSAASRGSAVDVHLQLWRQDS
jgi:general secretion pathway protein L